MVFIQVKDSVHCPLCGKKFAQVTSKNEVFYMCFEPYCMISINIKDPWVGVWDQFMPGDCPLCHTPMKQFARKLDGYLKIVCPKCKLQMETRDPDDLRFTKIKEKR